MLFSSRIASHSQICKRLENHQTTDDKLSILTGFEVMGDLKI